MQVYCEHGALVPALTVLQRQGRILLVHFPYDPDSFSPRRTRLATPSAARIADLGLPINRLPGTIDSYVGSPRFDAIQAVIGRAHRRDALHLDSAFKTGCGAFFTSDTDILKHAAALEALLGFPIYNPAVDVPHFIERLNRE